MYRLRRKNYLTTLTNGKVVNLEYRMLTLLFIFNFTFNYRYSVATKENSAAGFLPVTREEAAELNGGKDIKPPVWERYSFVTFFVLLIIVILVRVITS